MQVQFPSIFLPTHQATVYIDSLLHPLSFVGHAAGFLPYPKITPMAPNCRLFYTSNQNQGAVYTLLHAADRCSSFINLCSSTAFRVSFWFPAIIRTSQLTHTHTRFLRREEVNKFTPRPGASTFWCGFFTCILFRFSLPS